MKTTKTFRIFSCSNSFTRSLDALAADFQCIRRASSPSVMSLKPKISVPSPLTLLLKSPAAPPLRMTVVFFLTMIEGNTVTRLYFMRLRRLARQALAQGTLTPDLAAARRERVPTFTHFLDIPILFVIVALGAARPTTWMLFAVGTGLAVLAAAVLTIVVPHLYPSEVHAQSAW